MIEALASELKIMVRLGKDVHTNVVKLLGAVTDNVAKRMTRPQTL